MSAGEEPTVPLAAGSSSPGAGPAAGAAATATDFSGHWSLSRSTNLDKYLEAVGVSWTKRKVIVNMKPRQHWRLVGGDWEFTASRPKPLPAKVERLPIGAAPPRLVPLISPGQALTTRRARPAAGVPVHDEVDGKAVIKVSSWDEDGALVTNVRPSDPFVAEQAPPMSMCGTHGPTAAAPPLRLIRCPPCARRVCQASLPPGLRPDGQAHPGDDLRRRGLRPRVFTESVTPVP